MRQPGFEALYRRGNVYPLKTVARNQNECFTRNKASYRSFIAVTLVFLAITFLVFASLSTGAAGSIVSANTPTFTNTSGFKNPISFNSYLSVSDSSPGIVGFGLQSSAKPQIPSAPFTAGNLVIYRVGDGSATLSAAATAVFLDEYTPAGVLVQTIPLPTVQSGANRRLTASGSATSEGLMTRSADGHFLVFGGYDAALGTASVPGTTASTVNRVVGRVNASGLVDTTTALSDAFSTNNIRGVSTLDGTSFWLTGSSDGVRYVALLGANTSSVISNTNTNLRAANIFGNQLYISTSSGSTIRIGQVGTGTPTAGPQTITNLPGFPTTVITPYQFFFADLDGTVPGVDTLYTADDTANQIQKYCLVGGSWVARGSASATGAVRGLTGAVNGANVVLYATSGATNTGGLSSFNDTTGYNASISGSASMLTTAGTNKAFRGIAFAPLAANDPVTPNCPTPLNTIFGVGGSVGVSATDADATVASANISNITPIDPGTILLTDFTAAPGAGGTANASLNAGPSTPPGTYNVTINWSNNDPLPQSATCTVSVVVVASAPIVPSCPGNLNTQTGVTSGAGVSATDADGTVTTASITNIAPSNPGTITLTALTPAAGVGATATATLTVGSATPAGVFTVTITWSNNDPSPQTANCIVVVAVFTPIHTIQGSGNTSPLSGQLVTTSGIVTGIKSNGFYIQSSDAIVDANPGTSEGIFVFTSGPPPITATVGNALMVSGMVQEFIPSADPNSPPITELVSPLSMSLLSSGNPLPAAVTLTTANTSQAGSIQQLERFEGMRVHINSLTVSAPTQGSINESTATSSSNGVFYGVITGIARPFREPGIETPDAAPAGSPCCIPRFDANPERLRIDSNGLAGGITFEVTSGAIVTNITGPLDYVFRTYTILQDPPPAIQPVVSGIISAIPVPAPAADEFTVASFNMERFFDTTDDPGISDVALTTTAFNNRLNKASLAIRNVMRTPDIIGIEEMENLATLQAVATRINTDSIGAGQSNPNYQAFLLEGNDVGGIDVGLLVKAARVTVIDVTQVGKEEMYMEPGGMMAILNDRPSLVLRASITGPDATQFAVTVIVNHLRSLSGVDDPTDGNRVRIKRRAQAEFLAGVIQARQAADSAERIISVGDYNSFQLNDGYVDVMGTLRGAPTPPNEVVLASSDIVNPNMIDLLDTLQPDQRYSFSFDGNAQALDHELVSANLLPFFSRMAYARSNSDFPESYRNNPNRPERLSDHDMAVAYFKFNPVPCSFSLSSSILPMTARGGEGSVSVATGLACEWTVTSNDPWIVISSDSSGTGNSLVSFEIKENFAEDPRTGSLTIAGQTFTVVQDGAAVACSYSISPLSQSFKSSAGGSGIVTVTAVSGCGWVATSNASWITIATGSSGIGNGAVNYNVSTNAGSTRSGSIIVAGHVFNVKQKGN